MAEEDLEKLKAKYREQIAKAGSQVHSGARMVTQRAAEQVPTFIKGGKAIGAGAQKAIAGGKTVVQHVRAVTEVGAEHLGATKDTTLVTIIFLALMIFHLIDAGTSFFNLSWRIFVYLMGASVVLFLFHFKEKDWPFIAKKFSEDMGPEYSVGWLKLHFGRIAGLFLTVVFYSLIYRYMPDIQRMFLPLGALGNTIYIVLVIALILTIFYFLFAKKTWEALFKSVMLGFLATFIPVYLPYLSNLGVDEAVINIVLLFFPVYYVYFVFIDPPDNKFFKWLRNITLFIWLFIFLMTAYSAIEAGTVSYIPNLHAIPGVEAAMAPSALGALADFWRLVSNSFNDFWDATIGMFANIGKSWNQYLIYASGGYYQGTVEQNQDTPIGVYIDQLKSASPKFYEGETVSVYARLHGKTLEKNDALSITPKCENDRDKSATGEVSPSKIEIYDTGDEFLDCRFKEGFSAGSVKITLSASFDFTTMGYLKTYFIDEQKYEDFQKSGIDVFRHYGLEENPSAIYTNGPIMLGIGSRSPPIVVNAKSDDKILVAVTVENQWGGVVDNVEELTVEIPDGLEIENAGVEKEGCEYLKPAEDGEQGYKKYTLAKEFPVETFRSIRCYATIKDADALLGTTPVSTKYIRATVKYSYTVKKDITVEVEKELKTT